MQNTTDIRAKANALVTYSTNRAPLTVTHQAVTTTNSSTYHADPKALRTVASVFEAKGTPIGQINSLFERTRKELYDKGLRLTQSGDGNKQRTNGALVRVSQLPEINRIFDEASDELERLRGELRRQYATLVATSIKRLGTAADSLDWPDAEETTARFQHHLLIGADPTEGHVMLDGLTEEVAARVRAQVDEGKAHQLKAAHGELVRELLTFITGAHDKDAGILGVLDSGQILKRCRFERLQKRLEEAKQLNYLNLPEVDQTIKVLESVGNLDLDHLRADETARKEAATEVRKAASVTRQALSSLGL